MRRHGSSRCRVWQAWQARYGAAGPDTVSYPAAAALMMARTVIVNRTLFYRLCQPNRGKLPAELAGAARKTAMPVPLLRGRCVSTRGTQRGSVDAPGERKPLSPGTLLLQCARNAGVKQAAHYRQELCCTAEPQVDVLP